MKKTDFFNFVRKSSDTDEIYNRNTQYYLNYFTQRDTGGSILSWNWSAFLIPPIWMFYRKMYLFGAITCFLIVFMLWALASYGFGLHLLAGFIPHLAFGVFGNAIYYSFAERSISKGKKTSGTILKFFALLLSYVSIHVIALVFSIGKFSGHGSIDFKAKLYERAHNALESHKDTINSVQNNIKTKQEELKKQQTNS